MVDLNRKNTCCLAKIEFDDPSELVMIAVGELWINTKQQRRIGKAYQHFLLSKVVCDMSLTAREGTLRIVGDIRLNINELSNMMGWVINISKTVAINQKLLFSTSFNTFRSQK